MLFALYDLPDCLKYRFHTFFLLKDKTYHYLILYYLRAILYDPDVNALHCLLGQACHFYWNFPLRGSKAFYHLVDSHHHIIIITINIIITIII